MDVGEVQTFAPTAAMSVIGNTGTETFKIADGSTGAVSFVGSSVERVELARASTAYSYQATTTGVNVIYNGVTVAQLTSGQKLAATDGALAIAGALDSSGNVTFTVGSKAVTTTVVSGATLAPTVTTAAGDASTVTPAVPAVVTPTITLSQATTSQLEGGSHTYTATLSAAQTTNVTATYTTTYGTVGSPAAATAADLTGATTGTVTILAGQTTGTFTIAAALDQVAQLGQTIIVTLSAPAGATGIAVAGTPVTTTLLDNPAPTFVLTSNATAGAATVEGTSINYTITPSGPTDKAYTFTLSTQGDTLSGVAAVSSGADYSPASQTISFAAGATAAVTVSQNVVSDNSTEGLEGYKTSLLDSNYQVVGSSILGLITDPPVAAGVGATYTLTTSTDQGALFTGTTNNDTFYANQTTFAVTDTLDGGLGTDTLSITDAGTAIWALPAASVTGIENINVRNVNSTTVTAVTETQTIIITGTATSSGATFLGVAIAGTASSDTASATAILIANSSAAIATGAAAINAGIVSITTTGTAGEVLVTFGGTAGKGDVAQTASAGSLANSYSAGIETVKGVAAVAGGADSVSAGNFAGATNFNSDLSTSALTVTGMSATQQAGIIGNTLISNGAFSPGWGSSVTAATLNITGGTTGSGAVTLTGGGVLATTINSSGDKNTIGALAVPATSTSLTINATTNLTAGALSGAGLTSITASGAGSVSFSTTTAVPAAVTTINASGLTAGGITLGVLAGTVTSFTGGAGNDQVATAAALGTTTAGAINAAGGTGDRLVLTNTTDADTAAEANMYSGFEIIRNMGGTNHDISLFATNNTITAVELDNVSAGAVNMTAAAAAAVTVRLTQTSSTLSLLNSSGSADVLGLTIKHGTTTTTAVDVTALTITGFEILNVAANGGSKAGTVNTGTNLSFAAASNLYQINVSGAYDLTLDPSNMSTTKAATVTSTQSSTGALIVTGNFVVGSAVTGGAGNDIFTLGTVGTSYSGGAGNDSFSGTVALINTGAVYDAISGGDGTDTLTISNGAGSTVTVVDNSLSKITGIEKIIVTDTTSASQSITTGGWFDAAFKANGVDLTTNATIGNITIDMTSFSGNAKITATTVGTAAAEGVVSIQTGSGADTVTVTDGTTSNAATISTFDGNDTIVGGVNDETITGGKGMDVMTGGGTTANTFVFAAGDSGGAPSATTFDTITDFSAVATNVISVGAQLVLGSASTAVSGMAGLGAANGVAATFVAADNTLALKIVAVENALSGNTNTAWETAIFVDSGSTYVFIADGVAGVGANDLLIKLSSIDGTNIAFDVATLAGQTLTIA